MLWKKHIFLVHFICNVTFQFQTKKKQKKNVKIYMLKSSLNLFGTKWMDLFKLWDAPRSVLGGNIVGSIKG